MYEQDKQVLGPSLHGCMKGRSYSTNIICYYNKVIHLVDEEKVADLVYLGFSKAIVTVSPQHSPRETDCSWLGWVYTLLDKKTG